MFVRIDVKLKVKIASELRDSVEIFQSVEYARFLSILMPVFSDILMNGQPVFASNAPEQVCFICCNAGVYLSDSKYMC